MAEKLQEITLALQKTVPVVLLTVGSIGNVLSFIVLTRPQTRAVSTAIFLIGLTVTDFLAMWLGLIRILVDGYYFMDIRTIHVFVCKAHVFLIYTTTHVSSWLIVTVTIERVISVWWPFHTRHFTPKRALFLVGIIASVFMALNSHFLFGFTLDEPENITAFHQCYPQGDSYAVFIHDIWPWIDMTILFLMPFAIIVVGNILIIIRVKRSRKLRKRSCPYSDKRAVNAGSLYFLTALLVTLNVVFVLCVAPICIYVIGQYFWWPDGITEDTPELEWAINVNCWVLVNLLVYMNYSVNFILYLACGPKFREDLRDVFMCKCSKRPQRSSVKALSISLSWNRDIANIPTTDILHSVRD